MTVGEEQKRIGMEVSWGWHVALGEGIRVGGGGWKDGERGRKGEFTEHIEAIFLDSAEM